MDIESDRREEVIQYVYDTHGRRRAAQVANVITYRAKSAVRDMAKALGYSAGQQDAWSKQVDRWGGPVATTSGAGEDNPIPADVIELANQIGDAPRHMGIHSGGMVICDRPVAEVVPVEWARMPGRTVLQWDKDDCAAVGLVKFDLLGLGMLSALHYTIDLIAEHEHVTVDLAQLDLADPEVYDMLCAADAVGVFQVESRAQLATLPRLKPRAFYDLVVEVALICPGPIQGGSVHPYLARRAGQHWQHDHPLLAAALDRTLGVPLFQEQVMQMFSRFRMSRETSRSGCGCWSKRHVERNGNAACRPMVRHHGWPAGIVEVTRSLVGLPWAEFGLATSVCGDPAHRLELALLSHLGVAVDIHSE